MTKKSKYLISNSIDPVTTRLREAVYSNELLNTNKNENNNSKIETKFEEKHSLVKETEEENRRKKRRKSSKPNNSYHQNKNLEEEEYLDLYDEDYVDEDENNNLNYLIDNLNDDESEDFYQDNEEDPDEIFDELRKWNLDEKINILSKYDSNFVKFLDAKEFDFKYIQENGFDTPLVFLDKSGLGMRLPSENFRVSDVKSCVGSKRIIDVVDVNTQKGLTMSMKDWCEYYESPKRDRLLNVISLEFSHTKLENYVEEPLVVRQLDWIETAWPRHLREEHTESTNVLDKMKYPKVQKYVLMSVAGCYTDFHIDMGGTSVWYHVLKGEKIFWLIPPNEKNFKIYEKWILSGNQSNVFLPDLMDECQRIVLKKGCTFMLPSGWIHGVYTSKDSLVFGGNFLHSFNIQMQLKIYNIETKTKVPQQYRYPFYVEMMWFVLERYVHCLTGVTHMKEVSESLSEQFAYKTFQPNQDVSLNKFEYEGLKCLYDFLIGLNENKRSVPKEIVQPDLLLQSFKKILDQNRVKFEIMEEFEPANGTPFMHWPKPEKKFMKKIELKSKEEPNQFQDQINENSNNEIEIVNFIDSNQSQDLNTSFEETPINLNQSNSSILNDLLAQASQNQTQIRKHVMRNLPRTKGSIKKRLRPQNVPRSNVERRRRVRCHNCEPCTRDDCGDCKYCKDMKKFGGTGISKQCCLAKQCLNPLLPTTTTCMACDQLIDRFHQDKSNVMYECEICFEIYHVKCFRKQFSHLNQIEPIINEDLNNCWKCPNCVFKGYNTTNLKQDLKSTQLDICSDSNSLNNSFSSLINTSNNNSNCMSNSNIDFFLSPSSTSSIILTNQVNSSEITNNQKTKQKRNKRIKQEIEHLNSDIIHNHFTIENDNNNNNNIDLNLKQKKKAKLDKSVNNVQEDDSIISIDSLTYYEKQILLREFCEICYDDQNDTIKKKSSNKRLKPNTKNTLIIQNTLFNKSFLNGLQKNAIINNLETVEDCQDSNSFKSLSVNNNDSMSNQNSISETTNTDELNLDYDLDPSNEHIFNHDD